MKNKTDTEIKQIALDLHHGRIFCDRQLQKDFDPALVFMPLALLSGKQLKKLRASKPGMIYEYMEKAAPRSINGMPMFLSMQVLSRPDAKKVLERVGRLQKAEEFVCKEPV